MSENRKYWIWLSTALGAAARVDEILSVFPDPRKLFETDAAGRAVSGVFTRRQLDRLEKTKLCNAETAMSVCTKNGWSIIDPGDREFPNSLRRLTDMPLVLYVDGDISCLEDSIPIGIVGTRKPCRESIAIAGQIAGELAKAGAVVISGGALGIDSAAHEGAMHAGGKTVCVMGCGLGSRYLIDNEALRRDISRNGALVTEYPPLSPASRTTFPERNRIISGLSFGVLVVEAGEKSGSLITARRAVEQGREVFAIPGSILASAYAGGNNLIRDGARAVTCAQDILAPYDAMCPGRLNANALKKSEATPLRVQHPSDSSAVTKRDVKALDSDAQTVYSLFKGEPLHPDEICAATELALTKVIPALMRLEIGGYIEQTDGKNYILK